MVQSLKEFKRLPRPSNFDPKSKTIEIAGLKIRVGGSLPKPKSNEKMIRITQSICPYCYALLPAIIVERERKVYIRKICPEHGEIEELYFGDVEIFKKFEKWETEGLGPRHVYVDLSAPCPYSCGLCPLHKTHTALANLVVTNRCDLDCWYCFFYAEKSGFVYEPSLEEIKLMVSELLKQGVTPAIQLTGGEPTVRDDLITIVKILKSMGVRHIQLNTHGIKFARLYFKDFEKAVEYARELRQAGVNTVYLSFDGVTPKSNPKNHWEIPYIFEVFRKAGMTSVVLVPTVIKGINDHELGEILRFAVMNMDIVRAVNFQPVSLTGMMKKREREKYRITIADAIKKIEEQTDGQIYKDAWFPVPASIPISEFSSALAGRFKFEMPNHPHCGAATYVYVKYENPEKIIYTPITEFIDVEGFLNYLLEKAKEIKEGKSKFLVGTKILLNLIRKFIKWNKVPEDLKKTLPTVLYNIFTKQSYEALAVWHYKFLFIGMMHFMDLYNYDVERVMRCNIHYLLPDGRIIPFCTFNVLNNVYRDYVQKRYMIPLDEWAKVKGPDSIGEKMKYRRSLPTLKKLTEHKLYRKTYGYWLGKYFDIEY